jgi:hypothetical protein
LQLAGAALAIAMIVLGPLPVKVAFAYLLVAGVLVRRWDDGQVALDGTGITIRSFLRMYVPDADILRVGRYEPRFVGVRGSIARRLWGLQPPGLYATPMPSVRLLLRRRRWAVMPLPFPILLYKSRVHLFIREDEIESFVSQATARLVQS